jgi:hypothetical protein
MGRSDNVLKLMKLTGAPSTKCGEVYDECDGDMDEAIDRLSKYGKKKKPKDKKIFKPGDVVVVQITDEKGKLPPEAYEFLLTYKYFTVRDVNDKLNVDIGYITPDTHNPFFFTPNRFELKDGTAPIKKYEPTPEELAEKQKEEELTRQLKEEAERKKQAKLDRMKKADEDKLKKLHDFEIFKKQEEEKRKIAEKEAEGPEQEEADGHKHHWWKVEKPNPNKEYVLIW